MRQWKDHFRCFAALCLAAICRKTARGTARLWVILLRSHPDAHHMKTADSIARANPRWLVTWSLTSRHYSAYPMFAAPAGTVLAEREPRELLAQMRQTERQHLPPPTPPATADLTGNSQPPPPAATAKDRPTV